ncbi:MAG TPA: branched-chain amino acid ABC transporter permease [Trueperaceae bacterium]|nr:branched-chain amino acid ABC transporter permease [Trueperaceae bacterium]
MSVHAAPRGSSTGRPGALRRAAPWLGLAALLGLVVWRMYYLHGVNENFNAAFFAGAAVRSVQLGSLYALIALGYTMVYGIIRLINFAHGEVFMVGAFAAYFLFSATPFAWPVAVVVAAVVAYGFLRFLGFFRVLGRPVVLGAAAVCFVAVAVALASVRFGWLGAMVASMFLTGVLGMAIDRVAYKPLRGAPRNSMLITAIAVSFFLQNFGLLAFSNRQTPFRPPSFFTGQLTFQVGGETVFATWMIVLVPVVTLALVVVLTSLVTRTRLGRAMRATSQDAETARMMGVDVDRVIASTFLLGSILAAAAAVMWGMSFGSINQPAIFGILPGIKAFAAAVIGGIGSLPGAVIGGVLLGFLENFLTALFPRVGSFTGITEYKDTFAFLAMILILLLRPSGIVGEDLSEKV